MHARMYSPKTECLQHHCTNGRGMQINQCPLISRTSQFKGPQKFTGRTKIFLKAIEQFWRGGLPDSTSHL